MNKVKNSSIYKRINENEKVQNFKKVMTKDNLKTAYGDMKTAIGAGAAVADTASNIQTTYQNGKSMISNFKNGNYA